MLKLLVKGSRLEAFLKKVARYFLADELRRVAALEETAAMLSGAVNRLTQKIAYLSGTKPHVSKAWDAPCAGATEEFDYYNFEKVFHDEEVIKERQKAYVGFFKERVNVLDIGCGRGEFLEVMRAHDVPARGVDVNGQMVAHCRDKELQVERADFESYLQSLPDNSLGGIFSAQVVEHLELEKLNRFFKLGYRKLQPKGLLVVETVNPHCLPAFKLFYLDPTHIRPLFPEFLQFLAKTSGFQATSVLYLTESGFSEALYAECGNYALLAEK